MRAHKQSPSSPTKAALDQLIKGHEMALSSGLLLAQENRCLRTTIEELQQKRKRSNRQIAHSEGLSIQEGRDLFQQEDQLQEAQIIA